LIPPSSNHNEPTLKKAYFLWFFLGLFGAHRFYLGKKISGTILLILTLVWIASYALSKNELFGVLWLIEFMGPLQDWLVSFGNFGKWISTLVFLPILGFPVLWWLTDTFRIPRFRKQILNS